VDASTLEQSMKNIIVSIVEQHLNDKQVYPCLFFFSFLLECPKFDYVAAVELNILVETRPIWQNRKNRRFLFKNYSGIGR
jgi:hypothetical protein